MSGHPVPDANCHTLPDGSCSVASPCMHAPEAARVDTCATDRFPFAGIADRPFAQSQISVTWSYVKPEWVFLPDLWLTQTKVTIEGLFGKTYSTDQYPRAVRVPDGRVFLEDGHHRIVTAAKRGEQWAQIRVWDWPHGT